MDFWQWRFQSNHIPTFVCFFFCLLFAHYVCLAELKGLLLQANKPSFTVHNPAQTRTLILTPSPSILTVPVLLLPLPPTSQSISMTGQPASPVQTPPLDTYSWHICLCSCCWRWSRTFSVRGRCGRSDWSYVVRKSPSPASADPPSAKSFPSVSG